MLLVQSSNLLLVLLKRKREPPLKPSKLLLRVSCSLAEVGMHTCFCMGAFFALRPYLTPTLQLVMGELVLQCVPVYELFVF
jgi:hypothetical protein